MTEAQFPSRQEVLTKLRDANKRLSNSDAEEVHLGDEEGWLPVHSECGEPGRWMYVKTTVYRYKDTDLYTALIGSMETLSSRMTEDLPAITGSVPWRSPRPSMLHFSDVLYWGMITFLAGGLVYVCIVPFYCP